MSTYQNNSNKFSSKGCDLLIRFTDVDRVPFHGVGPKSNQRVLGYLHFNHAVVALVGTTCWVGWCYVVHGSQMDKTNVFQLMNGSKRCDAYTQ